MSAERDTVSTGLCALSLGTVVMDAKLNKFVSVKMYVKSATTFNSVVE